MLSTLTINYWLDVFAGWVEARDMPGPQNDEAVNAIAQLRAAAAESVELRTHLDALCSELAAATGHEYTPGANFDAHEAISQLSERISALKIQADMLDDYAETIRQHEITIAQQSAQLEQARKLLWDWHSTFFEVPPIDEVQDEVNAWLATNAPAPQEEQSDAEREEIISQHERDTQRGLLDAWHDRM